MKFLLALATLLGMAVLLTSAAAFLGAGVPAAVHYIDHDKVSATMAKGGAIVSDPGLVVLANRREAGPVEYHEHTNHIFIMVEGEATFVTGGTMVDAKQTGNVEWKALKAKEAFITSASLFVQPVVSIDGKTVANGKPGPMATRLREIYIDFARATGT